MPVTRTQEEIVERIRKVKPDDPFGFEYFEYVGYLDFEHVKEFLKPDAKEEEWATRTLCPLEVMRNYMPFAWDKANNFRGISAYRSLAHMVAWFWLAGEDIMSKKMDGLYEFYGKDKLAMACRFLGLDPLEWDDGVRSNSEGGVLKVQDPFNERE